jgi:hypothetical protein
MKKKKHKKSKIFLSEAEFDEHLNRAYGAFDKILELVSEFCRYHLTKEYCELCEDLTWAVYEEGLPLEKGRPAGWASGIVHAIGFVNFLHDPNHLPYMTSTQLAEGFGVSQQTMLTKSKTIRDQLDMMQFDPDWCLPSRLGDNPLVWMLDVDGFIMDARDAPLEFQQEAYRLGLIPYIPGEHSEPEHEPQSDRGARIIEFPSKRKNTPASQPARKARDDEPG